MALDEAIESGQVIRSAAEIYEAFFVPALFQRWAAPLADAAGIKPGQQVLDVACGTGVLARELRLRVGRQGSVTGLDINPGMLEVARRKQPSIDWQQAAAESLPFPESSFDAVVSQFGLMFFDDRKQAIREMARVLKPGGYLAVAVWDKLENTPGYAAASLLLHKLFGASIAESLRSPFVLGDTGLLRDLFDDTGFTGVCVDTVEGKACFASIEDWMHTDIKGWTLADALDDNQYALLLKEAKNALRQFVLGDGGVEFAASAHILTAIKE